MRTSWLAVALALFALAAMACSKAGGGSVQADGTYAETGWFTGNQGVPSGSVPTGNSYLFVKWPGSGNPSVPIKNGAQIQLGDGYVAELFVDPYPTKRLTAWLDVFIGDEDGNPAEGATISIEYDMFSMGHGPFVETAETEANGHSIFKLDYIMFGAWEQVLKFDLPSADHEKQITLVIVAAP